MTKNKILVIDDDLSLLEALEAFLYQENFEARSSSQHQSIHEIILDFNPDLIILDINLGDADGRSICDELKSNNSTAYIPVLLLTGLSYEDISQIDCLADGIIGKPFESSQLLFHIKELLSA
jgi:DNA-binding response OmpR family regulator